MPAPTYLIDEKLKEWATPRQVEVIDAVNKHKSLRAAAKALGVNYTSIGQSIRLAKKKAAIFGYSPEHDLKRPVAPGQRLRGASLLYKDGKAEPVLTWVKTERDGAQADEILREFVEYLTKDAKGLSPAVAAPAQAYPDLLAVYPWGDPHFGMYAWARESGDDFDLEVAERLTLGAVDRLVAAAPPAETAVLLPLGDFFHANDQTNQTPAHKHQLDVDSRYPKVLMVGVKAVRHAILRLLEKHPKVIARFEPGNHDPEAKWALALTIAAYFENEPRVTVDLTPGKFWYYRFGKVLIGSTHGDTAKHAALGGVMAADRPEDWGATKHRYWYTGHIHSSTVTELPGVVCESFRTLAAKDAYAAGHGYRAGRDMRLIVHHREYGEIERHRCDVAMVEDETTARQKVPG
jgi:hypothetical protein